MLTCMHFFVLASCASFVAMESKSILANSPVSCFENVNSVHRWFPGNWGFVPFCVVFRTSALLAEGARVGSFLPFQVQSL